MKRTGFLSIICAAAIILTAAGCKSPDIADNTMPAASGNNDPVQVTEPALTTDIAETFAGETVSAETSATTSNTGTVASETTVSDDESVVSFTTSVTYVSETTTTPVLTTTSEETSTPAVTVSSEETTAVVTYTAAATERTSAGSEAIVTETSVSETTEAAEEQVPAVPTTDDISMKIKSDGDITTDTYSFELIVEYIGDRKDVTFFTGAEYSIEKLNDGVWEKFPFAEDVTWISLGYEISAESNRVPFTIELTDAQYKEPLTAGTYRVIKNISGVKFAEEFEIKDADVPDDITNTFMDMLRGKKTEYDRNGTITLIIDEIKEDEFVCSDMIPLPGRYHVYCDTGMYGDYCVGDGIDVDYSIIYFYTEEEDEYYVEQVSIDHARLMLDDDVCYKPVVYLYPEQPVDVSVKLGFNGKLTVTDPEYGDGWTVTAYPDGTIVHNGREYPYLFWEGEKSFVIPFDEGFCVSGKDTESFLVDKLAYLGLNEKETAEFLEFWLPYMKDNTYNIISFAGSEYTDNAVLDITPEPDTVIRVFMQFAASDVPVGIKTQELAPAPARNGFTVVEWGGSVVNSN